MLIQGLHCHRCCFHCLKKKFSWSLVIFYVLGFLLAKINVFLALVCLFWVIIAWSKTTKLLLYGKCIVFFRIQQRGPVTQTYHFIWTISAKSCCAWEVGDSVVDPELPRTNVDLGLDDAKGDEFVSERDEGVVWSLELSWWLLTPTYVGWWWWFPVKSTPVVLLLTQRVDLGWSDQGSTELVALCGHVHLCPVARGWG